ncbi:MAG: hypothetical protein RR565_09715 [Erysipelothrix sp.]
MEKIVKRGNREMRIDDRELEIFLGQGYVEIVDGKEMSPKVQVTPELEAALLEIDNLKKELEVKDHDEDMDLVLKDKDAEILKLQEELTKHAEEIGKLKQAIKAKGDEIKQLKDKLKNG